MPTLSHLPLLHHTHIFLLYLDGSVALLANVVYHVFHKTFIFLVFIVFNMEAFCLLGVRAYLQGIELLEKKQNVVAKIFPFLP